MTDLPPSPPSSEPSDSAAETQQQSTGPGASQEAATDHARAVAAALRTQVERAVVGQREMIGQLLISLLAGGHVLLEGVPGLGKTLTVLALSRAFGGRFARIQFTPDLMPADVTGYTVYDAASGQFRLRRGPAFCNLLLADEINRAPAKTQAALLEVMQELQVSIDGQTLPLTPPFLTVATQNPIELEGTYPLPEAQLDRFLMKILLDYPEAEEEVDVVHAVTDRSVGDRLDTSAVEQVVTPEQVIAVQQAVAQLPVDRRVVDYAVRIVRQCRQWAGLRFGPGPRGAISIVRAARAHAVLADRSFVLPDDVKAVALPCLVHRVVLAPDLEIEGRTANDVLREVVEHVEAPRT